MIERGRIGAPTESIRACGRPCQRGGCSRWIVVQGGPVSAPIDDVKTRGVVRSGTARIVGCGRVRASRKRIGASSITVC